MNGWTPHLSGNAYVVLAQSVFLRLRPALETRSDSMVASCFDVISKDNNLGSKCRPELFKLDFFSATVFVMSISLLSQNHN